MSTTDASLRSLALRSTLWTVAGYGGMTVLRLGSNLVLSRVLFPAAFGVSSIIWIFMSGLAMFSDLGLGPNIIRHPRGESPDFLNTAWTLQIIRGFGLWACSAAIAWPVGRFYHHPELALMLPVAGLTAVFQGFSSMTVPLCHRRMQLGALISVEFMAQVCGILAMLGLALVWPSPWALVLGGVAGSLANAVLTYRIPGGVRHRLRWEPEMARELFSFGRWIFLNTLLTFLAMQSDRLLVGRLAGLSELGVYSIAMTLAAVPREVVGRLSGRVVFPLFTRLRDRSEGREKIRRTRGWILLLSGPVCAAFAAGAPALVDLLYDRRYAGAGPILGILAIGTWLQVVTSSSYNVIVAAGRPQSSSVGYALKFGIILGLSLPAYRAHGILGVAVVGAASELGVLIPTGIAAYRLGAISLRKELATHVLVFSLIPLMGLLLDLARHRPWGAAAVGLAGAAVGLAAVPRRLIQGVLPMPRSSQ